MCPTRPSTLLLMLPLAVCPPLPSTLLSTWRKSYSGAGAYPPGPHPESAYGSIHPPKINPRTGSENEPPKNNPGTVPEQSRNSPRTLPEQPQNTPRTVPEQPQNSPRTAPEHSQNSPRTAPSHTARGNLGFVVWKMLRPVVYKED